MFRKYGSRGKAAFQSLQVKAIKGEAYFFCSAKAEEEVAKLEEQMMIKRLKHSYLLEAGRRKFRMKHCVSTDRSTPKHFAAISMKFAKQNSGNNDMTRSFS